MKAYLDKISIEGEDKVMGVIIPIPDELIADETWDLESDVNEQVSWAVRARLETDRPDLIGKPWARLSRKLVEWDEENHRIVE